ncbi:accessory Sec system glycosyltransferase GtfA [Staphylococcus coagulans]|uniref:accessory Sec system glycosyltransferase GtfA n=1 Tax=Staphylococcus coagulans TaxID=74706 RepID=UPI001BEB3858|nr:accessory Sec system glycosyltransferase GtfA [Staphylococcus coagulans]MBT2830217.1 accessory Sec system glycosyltransferase GtfA [Staphylococcus coagulans]MBT2860052.1 accessory Sec system glycosyltransferase GtfA [Staphylococcus coagulans]MBU3873324.1 accessory Sec system glycosyltransferase GtfA [Staphylococcus coagulans]UNB48818.1 accessory Sec system glycosyltransferase GtfA [Staphylococcus coagulans]
MTVYNINLGIGWASSGVEYAQAYRLQLFRKLHVPTKFVFLDFIENNNIQSLTSNLGFKDSEIIWLYQYFTNIKISPSTIKAEDVIKVEEISKVIDEENIKKVFFDQNKNYLKIYLSKSGFVERVEHIYKGNLIKRDYYSYTHILSEYFAPENKRAKCYMREFYNENGDVAFKEYVSKNDSMFIFDDLMLYSKHELIKYFLKSLKLSDKDILLLDRSKDFGQVILENRAKSKVGVVVHAEHYNTNLTTEENILWNNYYEYVFNNAKEVDFFITATQLQNDILSSQFKKYYEYSPKIYTIPVGNLEQLKYSTNRVKSSIVTASRLAKEKHVDWLVKAIIKAKSKVSDLTFDVYGEGSQRNELIQIIENNKANDFIRLRGHVNLNDIYSKYELFLSGSTSEGFGLTLMESLGSGLGIVGFNVNYGNPNFIKDKKNGILLPIDINKDNENIIVDRLANGIISYFNMDMKSVQNESYRIARSYLQKQIAKQWKRLLNEVKYD